MGRGESEATAGMKPGGALSVMLCVKSTSSGGRDVRGLDEDSDMVRSAF